MPGQLQRLLPMTTSSISYRFFRSRTRPCLRSPAFCGRSPNRAVEHIFNANARTTSTSASDDYVKHFVPVLRPHRHQITGIVGAASWRRGVRNRTFHYDRLFRIEAAGTESVSFPKPVRFALCSVDRGHRLCKLLLAIHPPAQFVSSVLVNNSDLIFTPVFVRHMLSPYR